MIFTKFGTPVQFMTQIDPFTGWVTVLCDLGLNGTVEKEVDVLDLRADGGYDEIQAASDFMASMEASPEIPTWDETRAQFDESPEHVKGDESFEHLIREDWPADNEWEQYKDSN